MYRDWKQSWWAYPIYIGMLLVCLILWLRPAMADSAESRSSEELHTTAIRTEMVVRDAPPDGAAGGWQ